MEHKGKNLFETKYVSLVLSILAISMSAYAFWKAELYRPHLVFTTGESLNIGHYAEGNSHVNIPIVMTNPSNQTQVVERLALKVISADGVAGYLFEPYYYQRIDGTGMLVSESNPIPVSVDRNGMEVKNVLFRSSRERPFTFHEPGVYRVSVLSWTQGSDLPRESRAVEFSLNSSDVGLLAESGVKQNTIRVMLKKYEAWSAGPLTQEQLD